MKKSTFFPVFSTKTQFYYFFTNIRSFKSQSYPHNSQLFLWKVGITFENNAILPFFHNLSVENDFGLIFHFLQFIYKFVVDFLIKKV